MGVWLGWEHWGCGWSGSIGLGGGAQVGCMLGWAVAGTNMQDNVLVGFERRVAIQ